jgi:lipopolysaccharide transport system permease protein
MAVNRLDNNSDIPVVPEIVIVPRRSWLHLELIDLWRFRELLYFLAWRDIKVRYKQTALGVVWVILQPVLTMLIFSLIFGRVAGLPSDDVPYPIFVFAGLVPWQLFAYALTQSSTSLVNDQHLVTKIYFPRLVIPVASVIAGLLDFLISLVVLLGLLMFYRIPLTWRVLTLPVFGFLALAAAIAVGLWLSALNVQYRDVRYALPFLTLFWMYATPIAYSSSLIPANLQMIYSLNPMVGVVEGFRWALLGVDNTPGIMVLISIVMISILSIGGVVYFKRMEDQFADVI